MLPEASTTPEPALTRTRRSILVVLGLVAAFAVGLLLVGPALDGPRIAQPAGGASPVPAGGASPVPAGGASPVPAGGASPVPAGGGLARYGSMGGCYLSFEEGRFELGGPTGSYLVVRDKPIVLSWPGDVSTRPDVLSTAVVNARGEVLARTGQRAHIAGGYGGDGNFWACGFGDATFPIP